MNTFVLAIDIGNTVTHFGIIDTAALKCLHATTCPTIQIHNELSRKVTQVVSAVRDIQPATCTICSVANLAREHIEPALGLAGFSKIQWLTYHEDLPVRFLYDNPRTLGVDRIANCLFAHAAFSQKNVVIIDAGTAITIDYVTADGVFRGGAILPGVSTQLKALHQATARLPLIEPDIIAPSFPATNTIDNIRAGTIIGCAEALNGLIGRIEKMDGAVTRICCGGGWPILKNIVDFNHVYEPNCTLIGTGLFL